MDADTLDRYLARLVPGFSARPYDDFIWKFDDEVGDFEKEEVREELELPNLKLIVLVGGLVVKVAPSEDGRELWSLYETQERVEERAHIQAWAEFARGRWCKDVPTSPGVYPVKDLSGYRQQDHIFVRSGSRVVDTSSGFLQTGVRSNWCGWFWSLPYPRLPNAT